MEKIVRKGAWKFWLVFCLATFFFAGVARQWGANGFIIATEATIGLAEITIFGIIVLIIFETITAVMSAIRRKK